MKKAMTIILAVVLCILFVAGGYLVYLFSSYHRIEDNKIIEPVNNDTETLEAGKELTILSWNIGFCAYSSDYSFFMDGGTESRAYSPEAVNKNLQFVIDTVRKQQPDAVLLQEVDTSSTRSYHINQAEAVKDAFAEKSSVFAQNYDSAYLFFPVTRPHGASKSGLVVLSDSRIDSALRRSLPIESGIRKFFDLDRCYVINRIPTSDGKELSLFNLHLSAYTADGSIATEQIRMLAEDMRAEYAKGNYVIVGGDFNKDIYGDSSAYTGISGEDYSWAKAFPAELIPDGFALVDSLDKENPVMSCRDTAAPYEKGKTYEVTLDAFIVSDNVKVLSCRVLDTGFEATDHNPIRMSFVLGNE